MGKRTAIVTGASRGIGYAITEVLLENDVRVMMIAQAQDELIRACERLVDAGHSQDDMQVCPLDLSDPVQVQELVPWIRRLDEGLFGLVTNAAIEILKPAMTFTREELEHTWRLNILTPILLMQECYEPLKAASGSIVHVGSTADFVPNAMYSIYGGSKAFMNSFAKHAAQEMGFDGVRINVVSPGATDTPLMQSLIDAGQWSAEQIAQFKQSIPIEQRFARPREVAEAVWFALAGPRFFHGGDIRINGGHK